MAEQTLFTGDEKEWHLNACVGYNGGVRNFYLMAESYFEVANIVAETVIKSGFGMDKLVYPIIFNYRHGVELYLKHLLWQFKKQNKEEVNIGFFNHKLDKKWIEIKNYIKHNNDFQFIDNLAMSIKFVNGVISDIDKHDSSGHNYRYHISKSKEINQKDVKLINIKRFYEDLNNLKNIFDYWSFLIDEIIDFEASRKVLLLGDV